jgi:hypothetical protein
LSIKSDEVPWLKLEDATGTMSEMCLQVYEMGVFCSKASEVAGAFAEHSDTVYNGSHLEVPPFLLKISELLSLAPISNSDVCTA